MAVYDVEHKMQSAFFEYLDLQKDIRPLAFAIPNGGHRNIIVAKKLKKEGVTPGVADIFIAIPKNDLHGLFIEFKFGVNKQTKSQEEFEANVKKQGYSYELCYSVDEAIDCLNYYLKERKMVYGKGGTKPMKKEKPMKEKKPMGKPKGTKKKK